MTFGGAHKSPRLRPQMGLFEAESRAAPRSLIIWSESASVCVGLDVFESLKVNFTDFCLDKEAGIDLPSLWKMAVRETGWGRGLVGQT